MELFGKDISDVSWFHDGLMGQDSALLEVQRNTENEYLKSPVRQNCILCASNLEGNQRFERNQITYIFCSTCGHVNGNHLISSEFIASTYTASDPSATAQSDSGAYDNEFTSGKMAEEYWEVVERIYQPKSDFLASYLQSRGLAPKDVSVLDAGCGSGHFVNALKRSGFSSAKGFDSFAPAVLAAQQIGSLGESEVSLEKPENLLGLLAESDASVVAMMCVLVHLNSPLEAMRVMQKNEQTRFTFQKIPMWSFATILESALPNFRSRVLGSDHTNVFTEESLAWMEAELGLRRVASWRFGGDYLDLQRKILISMKQNSSSQELLDRTSAELDSIANEIQLVFDRNAMASELHVIWELS